MGSGDQLMLHWKNGPCNWNTEENLSNVILSLIEEKLSSVLKYQKVTNLMGVFIKQHRKHIAVILLKSKIIFRDFDSFINLTCKGFCELEKFKFY